MRMITATLALSALVACTGQDELALEHRSQRDVQARGLSLDDAGEVSNVGMSNTTCNLSTLTAEIQEDYNYGPEAELVVDGGDVPSLGTVDIVLTPDTVNVTTPDVIPNQLSFPSPGVVDASLYDDGVVAVRSTGATCAVSWQGLQGVALADVALDSACADGAVAVSRDGQLAYVATDAGVLEVAADGSAVHVHGATSAMLAFDDASDVLYVADMGGDTLTAVEAGGAVRWSTSIDGAIMALSEVGDTGRAAISVAKDTTGEFVVLDGLTGVVTSDVATPSAAAGIAISGNGQVLGVSLASAVHYFDLRAQ